MFTKLSKQQSGFTIVELLIVIVVIGILAALVLNTFQGVQARARDTERKTDINALHTQYEVFYNDNGAYPLTTEAGDATNFPGLDEAALTDPNNGTLNTNNAVPAAGSSDHSYNYQPSGDVSGAAVVACDNATTPCISYTLGVVLEAQDEDGDGNTDQYLKNSLN